MTPASPIDPGRRAPIIDVLRGWALLGVVLVNFSIFFSYGMPWPGIHDLRSAILQSIVQLVFLTKAWTMLSFLFGYGFAVLMKKAKATQKHPYVFFSWRMALLLLIALFNSTIYYGDILRDYVILGMAILCISKFGEKAYLWSAMTCFVLLPVLIPWSQRLGLHNPVVEPDLALYSSPHLSDVLKYGWLSGLHTVLSFPKYFDWNLVMLVCGLLGAYAHGTCIFETAAANQKLFKQAFFIALAAVVALGIFHQRCFPEMGSRPDLRDGTMVPDGTGRCFRIGYVLALYLRTLPHCLSIAGIGRENDAHKLPATECYFPDDFLRVGFGSAPSHIVRIHHRNGFRGVLPAGLF
jgi:uncharacterized protein